MGAWLRLADESADAVRAKRAGAHATRCKPEGAIADGFTVDRAALLETAQGLSDTIKALGKLGFAEEATSAGGFPG